MVVDHPAITSSYYLPHHGVFKSSSSSTKLRVVFHAPQNTSSGKSLNDLICIGPKLQNNLHDLIVRWRTHFVVFTADIEKMYRQILVHESDTQLQRIVWSPGPGILMQDYRLLTVTYGTASAPYLALRTLKQLSIDEGAKYPLANQVLQSDFYVDNVLSGAEDETNALAIQNQLRSMLQAGGFTLKKWSSNRKSVLEAVPENFRECNAPLSLNPDDCVKTLSLYWFPLNDTFQYKVNKITPTKSTKRGMLSDIAKLYDPIGLLAPIIITAKIMLQALCISSVGWDDPLPNDVTLKWHDYRNNLKSLEKISIDRWVGALGVQHRYQLHGFSDASSKAYAAAVYLRVENASELLAQLMVRVKTALPFNIDSIFAWIDSTIVLHWLNKEPNVWKVFVGNRVSKIQQLVPSKHWGHVSTVDNPADHATRGMTPNELKLCVIWWSGPKWLASPTNKWPAPIVPPVDDADLERKSTEPIVSTHMTSVIQSLLLRFFITYTVVKGYCLVQKIYCQYQNFKSKQITTKFVTIYFLC